MLPYGWERGPPARMKGGRDARVPGKGSFWEKLLEGTGGMSDVLRLLVIDDDVELCELLSQYLEPHGFRVSSVHDGEAGLRAVAEEAFDLVVLE